MNRPDFLARILQYYADTHFKHFISVGDASDPDSVRENKDIIERLKGCLNIRYYSCQGLTVAKSIRLINEDVATPYATFTADDDFIVTRSIEKCIAFLEANLNYTGAHGHGVVFTLRTSDVHGPMNSVGYYRMGELNEDFASERLKTLLSNYFVPLFSIHRLPAWKKMWQHVAPLTNVPLEGEMLPCCMAAIQGKIKKLDCLYLFRQDHQKRNHPDRFDWITMPTWAPSYQLLRRFVTEELAEKDRLEVKRADEILKMAFWTYLSRGLTKQYHRRYQNNGFGKKIKTAIKSTVFGTYLRSAWVGVKNNFSSEGALLIGLENPSSPYYDDFQEVCKTVSAS